jgi:hypothetical protein
MNPAFGRSSRDLASDSGPAAAPQGLWSTPGTDTETTAGTGQTADPDATPDRRGGLRAGKKTNPDVDPDTRLGLRPATRGMVAPQLPTYPVSEPGTRVATGALAGLIGAAAVVVVAYGLHAAGAVAAPSSLSTAVKVMNRPGGGGALGYVAGIFGALMAGAIWGLLFGLLVRRPTILKGMVFGILPALFQWLVLSPLLGQGLFFSRSGLGSGIGLPLLFNVLIFGSLIGYYCGRWLRPPYTGAVDPDLTSAVPNP